MTQKSQEYSETSTPNISKTNTRTRVVTNAFVPRKFLGVPVSVFMFLIVMTSVLAIGTILQAKKATVRVTPPDYMEIDSTGLTDSGEIWSLLNGVPRTEAFTLTNNKGGSYTADVSTTVTLTKTGLADGECQVWLLDGATSYPGTRSGNTITVTHNFLDIGATPKTGQVKVQCHPDAPAGDYALTLTATSTADFTLGQTVS